MKEEIQQGYVNTETRQGITSIEFFHPQSNSLPGEMLEKLAQCFRRIAKEEDTKVIILRSAGDRTFCAGASFDELSSIETEKQGQDFFNGFAHVINEMRKCGKLIIGRVQGKCVGGGVGLAAAVDYCIATDKAEIKLSELAVGIGPFVVGPAVERKIGISAFSQLSIDATQWRGSEWAKRKGLFAEVHETIENMDESIQRLANTLVHSNPQAMIELKKMIWHGTEHWDELLKERAAISGKLVLSAFTREAIGRFKKPI